MILLCNTCSLSATNRANVLLAEVIITILWILEDFFWVQGGFWPGTVFATLAFLWSFVFISWAVEYSSTREIVHSIAQMLWTLGNGIWLFGELHDVQYPNNAWQLEDGCCTIASVVLAAALALMVSFSCVAYFIPLDSPGDVFFEDHDVFNAHVPFFRRWRHFELLHLMFWLGKDLAWTMSMKVLWIIFAVPTVTMAVYFVFISHLFLPVHLESSSCVEEEVINEEDPPLQKTELYSIRRLYESTLLWVSGNILYATSELFIPKGEDFVALISAKPWQLVSSVRWWSGVLFILSVFPLCHFDMFHLGKTVDSECTDPSIQTVTTPTSRDTTISTTITTITNACNVAIVGGVRKPDSDSCESVLELATGNSRHFCNKEGNYTDKRYNEQCFHDDIIYKAQHTGGRNSSSAASPNSTPKDCHAMINKQLPVFMTKSISPQPHTLLSPIASKYIRNLASADERASLVPPNSVAAPNYGYCSNSKVDLNADSKTVEVDVTSS